MKKKALVILCFMVFVATAAVPDVNKHEKFDVNCADCHGVDAPESAADAAMCVECHGGYDDLAPLTDKHERNPHMPHADVACTECHAIHKESVYACGMCHSDDEPIVP